MKLIWIGNDDEPKTIINPDHIVAIFPTGSTGCRMILREQHVINFPDMSAETIADMVTKAVSNAL